MQDRAAWCGRGAVFRQRAGLRWSCMPLYTGRNGYIEACKTVQLGVGAAQYSANGQACDGLRPGIWRVSVEPAGSVFDGKWLPKCAEGEWLCTPQIKCCREIGYRVQVKEGYYR